jgi:hypothetical protein
VSVRDPGQLSVQEIQRLVGELVLTAEAHRLRAVELEVTSVTPPNGHVPAPVEMATPAED